MSAVAYYIMLFSSGIVVVATYDDYIPRPRYQIIIIIIAQNVVVIGRPPYSAGEFDEKKFKKY